MEKDDEELDPLTLLEQLLELLVESELSEKEDDEELADFELLLGLNELELELVLLSLKLRELEQLLSLRYEEEGELEQEDLDMTQDDEYEQLLLLLSWLEHWLLDEHDEGTDAEKQLEELLEETEKSDELELEEKEEWEISLRLLLEQLLEADTQEVLLEELNDERELEETEQLLLKLECELPERESEDEELEWLS